MLAVIGDLVEDVVVWCETVRYATDNAAQITRARGGSAANVAAVAGPHVATRFIGCVGADAVGDELVAELQARGVDTRVQRRGRTGTIVVIVDSTGERTMFPDRGASTQLRDVPEAWLESVRLLHVPSYCFSIEPMATATLELIARARRAGIEISLDASSTGMVDELGLDRYRQLVAGIKPDLLFANHEEADLLDLRRPEFTDGITVVKDGPRAAVVREPSGATWTVPVPSGGAAIRDTTGAGDAFAGGFLVARLRGADLAQCAVAGHEAARAVLHTPGAVSRSAESQPALEQR